MGCTFGPSEFDPQCPPRGGGGFLPVLVCSFLILDDPLAVGCFFYPSEFFLGWILRPSVVAPESFALDPETLVLDPETFVLDSKDFLH